MTEQLEIPLLMVGEALASAQSSHTEQPANRIGILSYPSLYCHFNQPSVYAIGDKRNGKLIYIGKSRNPSNRFHSYRAAQSCHNQQLKNWLLKHGGYAFCTILYSGPDIDDQEKILIERFKNQLFNCQNGSDEAWKLNCNPNKPWTAKKGIHAPSIKIMRWLMNRRYSTGTLPKIREMINSMTVINRVKFEISLAMDYEKHPSFKESISKWLEYAGPKMVSVLEASQ